MNQETEIRTHYHARSQFIRTRGALRIYWAPAVHNECTRGLLARSAEEHEREVDRMVAAQLQRFTTQVAASSTSAAAAASAALPAEASSSSASMSDAAESASDRNENANADAEDEATPTASADSITDDDDADAAEATDS
jgi:hypothetical protein